MSTVAEGCAAATGEDAVGVVVAVGGVVAAGVVVVGAGTAAASQAQVLSSMQNVELRRPLQSLNNAPHMLAGLVSLKRSLRVEPKGIKISSASPGAESPSHLDVPEAQSHVATATWSCTRHCLFRLMVFEGTRSKLPLRFLWAVSFLYP